MLLTSHTHLPSSPGTNDKVIRARAFAALIGRFWTGGN
jgi:hypothetical protein